MRTCLQRAHNPAESESGSGTSVVTFPPIAWTRVMPPRYSILSYDV